MCMYNVIIGRDARVLSCIWMEVREQPLGTGFLTLPCRFRELNSGPNLIGKPLYPLNHLASPSSYLPKPLIHGLQE